MHDSISDFVNHKDKKVHNIKIIMMGKFFMGIIDKGVGM